MLKPQQPSSASTSRLLLLLFLPAAMRVWSLTQEASAACPCSLSPENQSPGIALSEEPNRQRLAPSPTSSSRNCSLEHRGGRRECGVSREGKRAPSEGGVRCATLGEWGQCPFYRVPVWLSEKYMYVDTLKGKKRTLERGRTSQPDSGMAGMLEFMIAVIILIC